MTLDATFSPVGRDETLAEKVYGRLRSALVGGRLVPGQKLVHRQLALELGVSPTPVREALLRLVSEGALDLDARGIAWVPRLPPDRYAEIMDLRVELEGRAAARAAGLVTAADIAALRAIHDRLMIGRNTMDGAIVRMNAAAPKVFGAFFVDPSALPDPPDMISMVFDPRLMRPFVVDWPTQARAMVSRLHRERLERSGDERIEWALERALSFPDVPREWRTPDFSREVTPSMTVRLQRGDLRVGFLVTVTTFSAPQQVTLEELRIEAAFPIDDETRAACVRLTS